MQSKALRDVVKLDLRFLSDNELENYLVNTDVVLFPYHRIDASGALMATIPFEKIILASEVGIFGESLIDGESGVLIEPGNAEQLAKSIIALVNDDDHRTRLKQGSRKLAEEIPSWDTIGRLTKSIYRCGAQ